MVTLLTTVATIAVVSIAELMHWRRLQRVAGLAFGPAQRPAFWVFATPLLRVAGMGALVWGLLTLLLLPPKTHLGNEISENEKKHLLLVLDVSPSMRLEDAGTTGKQTRLHRTADVVQSLFDRLGVAQYRMSVVAFYTGAKAVVTETSDMEVVHNIIADLPMHHAFISGKTDMFAGLQSAVEVAHNWRPKSATMVVLSDGDTIPATGMPKLPPSIGGVLVVGIGDERTGSFIDGRQSKQDASTLRQLAVRLGGHYHNANTKHIPTKTIRELGAVGSKPKWEEWTRREYALLACILSAVILSALPFLLHYLGTSWTPGIAPETQSYRPRESNVSSQVANTV